MTKRPVAEVLIDTINEALFTVDREYRITAFNRAAEELTGYGADEVIGTDCSKVFRSDICETQCAVKESIRRGCRVPHRRVRMRRRDGAVVPISVSSSPLHDESGALVGAVETIRTMTELERTNEALERETSQKMSILESLAEGVVTVDHNWRVTSMNAAAEKMLKLAASDSMGRLCSQVLRADHCENGCPLTRTLEGDIPVRDEVVNLTRVDGVSLEVSLNAGVLRAPDGEALGGILSFRELTEVDRLRSELAGEHHFHGIIGKSPAMRAVYRLLEDVADSDATVLITGESGTGKEIVADVLQKLGRRASGPFIKVNCGVLADGVLESELFGHVRGAFTDAHSARRGRFELAHRGTLFLDEIGDISHGMQVKLLRILEEKCMEPVGSEQSVNVDVRIVAATNRSLPDLVKEGRFREDLDHRLHVIPINLPPLRERREDIPLLQHFLRKYQLITGKNVSRIHDKVLDLLMAYSWPGNVRQLENVIEFAFVRARGEVLTADLLPCDIRGNGGSDSSPASSGGGEAGEVLTALNRHHWHHQRAAEELGISRTTLWRRMKRLGLVDGGSSTES